MTAIDTLPGAVFNSYAFGTCVVRKVYTHPETGETCLDVKSILGDNLNFSFSYARKLRDEGRQIA
jgi:hypothetical protein